MKTLKILITLVLIILLAESAHAKFYYNFGLNLGLAGFNFSNVDPGNYTVCVPPYAPVAVTLVYTPPPYSYVSYYDYGNCWWWPNISLSFGGCGGSVCSYYSTCYTPVYYSYCSPVSFCFNFDWDCCKPHWGTYCGYYGWNSCGYLPDYCYYDDYNVTIIIIQPPLNVQRQFAKIISPRKMEERHANLWLVILLIIQDNLVKKHLQ